MANVLDQLSIICTMHCDTMSHGLATGQVRQSIAHSGLNMLAKPDKYSGLPSVQVQSVQTFWYGTAAAP